MIDTYLDNDMRRAANYLMSRHDNEVDEDTIIRIELDRSDPFLLRVIYENGSDLISIEDFLNELRQIRNI